MSTADDCTQQTVTLDSGLTFGWVDDRFSACGAVGHPHHPKCDVERRPNCEGQLIICGCLSA